MADRIALCIEPDTATAEQIKKLLTPNGFQVKNIPSGDDAMEWGRSHKPSVIVLSVEPKKVGYAICNKLRRSPSLREVPLVLMSSEETQAVLDQHKKLKAHADEYMLKPFAGKDLLVKIGGLLKVNLSAPAEDDEVHELDADSDIVMADDDDVDIVSSAAADENDEGDATLAVDPNNYGVVAESASGGDTSQQEILPEDGAPATPFEGEKFDPETQAAFAALEAGSPETASSGGDMIDLRNLWSDDDLPPNLAWEKPTVVGQHEAIPQATDLDPDVYRTGETLGPEPMVSDALLASALSPEASTAEHDLPPAPDELAFDDVSTEASGRIIPEGFAAPVADDGRVREAEARNAELEARIHSLENERQTLRKEIEEARERFTQSATFSKEREFLGLREIINKKEKDILDLRDALDAKERQILDHKDKIRELDRSRRDLEESTIGFERSLVAANERVAELGQDREKSAEREKGLKARLDDAHVELRKAHDEIDAIKKRAVQDEQRARSEADRLRGEMEMRLAEADEAHRNEMALLADEHGQAMASAEGAREAELARIEAAHKGEVDALQRRLADDNAQAGDRLTNEVAKLRKEHEKAIASARDEQAVQLATERQSYEAQAEQKERDHRNEILGMRRRHEEEALAAEERRQRDIAEQEARRVAELEAAENRRRGELTARDEDHHVRVTEIERRHLAEKTELTEKHRGDYDQALGRAARAEGELAARVQEIEQAYRRLSGLEADLDAARAELGNREVRLAQGRDRISELEAKVADYEDQIVRAFQRIRADDKTAEKTRRALAVALALLDERAPAPAPPTAATRPPADESKLET
ncbi:MAG TPA: response regulator [Polyangia bacterium]|jgi:DNA-binding response OmpR family regulator|nr:response regulator [Polyangia bacterium]